MFRRYVPANFWESMKNPSYKAQTQQSMTERRSLITSMVLPLIEGTDTNGQNSSLERDVKSSVPNASAQKKEEIESSQLTNQHTHSTNRVINSPSANESAEHSVASTMPQEEAGSLADSESSAQSPSTVQSEDELIEEIQVGSESVRELSITVAGEASPEGAEEASAGGDRKEERTPFSCTTKKWFRCFLWMLAVLCLLVLASIGNNRSANDIELRLEFDAETVEPSLPIASPETVIEDDPDTLTAVRKLDALVKLHQISLESFDKV